MITDRQETGQRKRSDSDTVDHHDLQSHVQVDEFRQFTKEEIEQSIPVRFEKIVRLYPDRLAVKVGNKVVTYSELNAIANRVGHSIVAQRGTDPEPVGLLFEKGVPLMAALLGVLKTGKFFVLLDPLFPKARIANMLKDSRATFVVTDQQDVSFTELLPGGGCDVIELINQSTSLDDLTLPISPKSFALIYQTSGSTGRAKGVVQTHQNILHDVMLRTNAYHVCHHDRLCLLSSGTASTVLNVFLALLDGATLLPFDTKKEGVIRLTSWLSQEKISICWISSPLFRKLAEAITGSEEFPDLRLIRLASEGVYKVDVDLYKKVFPAKCMLANGLSSSESGLLRTYLIDHKTEIAGNDVPVGYPVEDKEVLLMDDEGNEVGFNQVGEIVVRSRYLSPGYWRQPNLTAAKFKPDPHDPEKHLYYTGDLGLMLPDGCLIHKGRKDFRVKIRGYGVEIAEVEKFLREHALIKDTVVVARQNEMEETRLIAYFTSSTQQGPTTSELREFLIKKLPDYMIPSAFVRLDALPLTLNGKVDRKALPEPETSRPELGVSYVSPRTAVEQQLAIIWAEILSMDRVGIRDNFFDLGGHSLAATRVVFRIVQAFKLELPLKALFDSPTIAEMAVVIRQNQAKKASQQDMERMLAELEAMSEEEAKKLLPDESARSVRRGINE